MAVTHFVGLGVWDRGVLLHLAPRLLGFVISIIFPATVTTTIPTTIIVTFIVLFR